MNLPKVSVIVLNYNSRLHLQDCFASLLALDYPAECCELILADNGSHDGSVEWARTLFPGVRIVLNGENLGFAEGNNRGANMAQGEYVAFLNPDMRVDSSWLRELVQPCLDDSQVACVGSKILSWDGKTIDFAGAGMNFMGWGFQNEFGRRVKKSSSHSSPALFVCGGAMLIRRDVFLAVGGFDPDFFAFFEDVDIGWRLWLLGHQIVFAPKSIVYHRHHGAWGSVNNSQKWVLYERNTLASVIKNYAEHHLVRVLPAILLLMMQRACRGISLNDAPDASARASNMRYTLERARQLLGARAYRRLWYGGINKLRRRLQPVHLPSVPDADGSCDIPALAISRLLAARTILQTLATMKQKRQQIQVARQRTDAELFPLFQNAFVSNFDDEQFIHAMQVAIERFDLLTVFRATETVSMDPRVVVQSCEVSEKLLQVMDRTLNLCAVPLVNFHLGGPLPASTVHVSPMAMTAFTEMNALLWSLPDASLPFVLAWLADRCDSILNTPMPHA